MEVRTITAREQALVVRSNRLIEANFDATLLQMRVWFWLISEIRTEDREFQSYRVYVQDLAQYVGIEKSKNIYHDLRTATEGMMSNVIQIERDSKVQRGKKNRLQVSMLSSAEYEEGGGYVSLSFDPKLRPYLLDLKANFTKSRLRVLMAFKGSHAVRIYELLDQYRAIGKRTVEVDRLRFTLGIGDRYKLYGHFKARVLVPALKEINERTDLVVEMSEQRQGKRVSAVTFTMETRAGFSDPVIEHDAQVPIAIIERMKALGMKEADAQKLFDTYGEAEPDRLSGNCEKLEQELKEGKKIKNSGGWLARAIKEDWRDQKALFAAKHEEAEQRARDQRVARETRLKEKERKRSLLEQEKEDAERAYLKHRFQFVRDIIEGLDPAVRDQWEFEFSNNLEGLFAQQWARKPGEWWSRILITYAETYIWDKIEKRCEDDADYLKSQGKRSIDKIQADIDTLR